MLEAEIVIDRELLPSFCLARHFMEDSDGETKSVSGRVTLHSIPMKNGIRHLARIGAGESNVLIENLRQLNNNTSLDFTSGSYVGLIDTSPCPLYAMLAETSCFLVDERPTGRVLVWTLVARSRAAVRSLIRKMSKEGRGVRVRRLRRVIGGNILTVRQAERLKAAYESGFFEYPRKIGIRELARSSGCSPSTFAVTLRRAEKKVLAENIPEID